MRAAWGHPRSGALLLLLGLAAAVLLSPLIGPEPLPWKDVLSIMLHQAAGGALGSGSCLPAVPPAQCHVWTVIVWDARVPAVLLAAFVGASLGVSGASLQGVFRNPLADPYLLGLSSGAALGAAAAFALTVSPGSSLNPATRSLLLPVAAFAGGLVPGTVVLLASLSGRVGAGSLIMVGIALNALFSAIISAVLLYNQNITIQVTFWLWGGLSYATWTNDALVLSVLMVAGMLLALHGRPLNLLQLGEDVASSLGTDAPKVMRRVVLLTTILTAAAVAFVGIIGFVGLIAPHVVRRVVGVDYRRVLPLSMATGAGFLIISWDAAQIIIPTVVLPVGILTGFVGSAFFLYVLFRRWLPRGSGSSR